MAPRDISLERHKRGLAIDAAHILSLEQLIIEQTEAFGH